MIKLNIGCGQRIEPGWINIDLFDEASGAKPPQTDGIVSHDVRKGLPYANESVDLIFSEHFIEHLTRDEGQAFLKECFRVMKSGGIMRVSTPDLEQLAALYLQEDDSKWRSFFSVVGYHPKTRCQMMNEGMRDWGHRFIYDVNELWQAIHDAGFNGFASIKLARHQKRMRCEDMLLEGRPYTGDLVIEVTK